MFNVLQSAYKQFHPTKTALLKVSKVKSNDVTLNISEGKVTALTLLEVSAAFDIIDHNILIKRLSMWYIWHNPELVYMILNERVND